MNTLEGRDDARDALTADEFEQYLEERLELYRRAKTDPSIKLPVINGIEDMLKFNEMTERSRAGRW